VHYLSIYFVIKKGLYVFVQALVLVRKLKLYRLNEDFQFGKFLVRSGG
jgi:hypothetical protein